MSRPTILRIFPLASAPSMEPWDVSGLSMFEPQISGAMFDYEIPTTEELLELGFQAGGDSPTWPSTSPSWANLGSG